MLLVAPHRFANQLLIHSHNNNVKMRRPLQRQSSGPRPSFVPSIPRCDHSALPMQSEEIENRRWYTHLSGHSALRIEASATPQTTSAPSHSPSKRTATPVLGGTTRDRRRG